MSFDLNILRPDEQINLRLRSLYERYGYRRFCMTKFEEYAFYMRNRNFLQSRQIITFTDTDGKLMALKPDITLSIIKNTRAIRGAERIYYTESVYRVPHNAGGFREIEQTGVELIGDIDDYACAEVVSLAAESLALIGGSYMVDISHMGFVAGIFDDMDIDYPVKKKLFGCIESKNPHDISAIAAKAGIDEETTGLLLKLATLGGSFNSVLPELERLCRNEAMRAAVDELKTLWSAVAAQPFAEKLRLDLSIVSDTDYYNGLIFRGYVEGIPAAVLVGGRYDRLLHRMGKSDLGAIGFAVGFDALDRYLKKPEEAPLDTLILYSAESDISLVGAVVREKTAAGQKVLACKNIPAGVLYKSCVTVGRCEVKEEKGNA